MCLAHEDVPDVGHLGAEGDGIGPLVGGDISSVLIFGLAVGFPCFAYNTLWSQASARLATDARRPVALFTARAPPCRGAGPA